MIPKKVTVWWDGEGDFLEVTFDDAEGTMRKTADGKAMVKLDEDGNVVGFHTLGVSKTAKKKPFEIELRPGPRRKLPA
ncbi:MAG: DUF2283 domain-containing protein [Chloroflexi bacterium]|nr:DUF2283 domain-containing protein [Chloroflexota bacterium]